MFDLSPAEQLKGVNGLGWLGFHPLVSVISQSIQPRNVENGAVVHLDVAEVPVIGDRGEAVRGTCERSSFYDIVGDGKANLIDASITGGQ